MITCVFSARSPLKTCYSKVVMVIMPPFFLAFYNIDSQLSRSERPMNRNSFTRWKRTSIRFLWLAYEPTITKITIKVVANVILLNWRERVRLVGLQGGIEFVQISINKNYIKFEMQITILEELKTVFMRIRVFHPGLLFLDFGGRKD